MKTNVLTLDAKKAGDIELDEAVLIRDERQVLLQNQRVGHNPNGVVDVPDDEVPALQWIATGVPKKPRNAASKPLMVGKFR